MATIYKRSAVTTLNSNTAWDLTGAGGAGPAGPPGATDTAYWQAASLGGTLTGAISPLAVQIDGATADITWTTNTLSVGTGGIIFGAANNRRWNVTTGVIAVGANNQTWALSHTASSSSIGLSGTAVLTGTATINVTNNSGVASNGRAYILVTGAQAGFTGTFDMADYTAIVVSGASNLTGANVTVSGTGVSFYSANATGDVLGATGKTLTVNNNVTLGVGLGRALTIPMSVSLGSATRTITTPTTDTIILSGPITGTAGFTKSGAGSLTLTSTSSTLDTSVSGSAVDVSVGKLQLGNGGASVAVLPSVEKFTSVAGTELEYFGTGAYTETADIAGVAGRINIYNSTGGVTFNGAGVGTRTGNWFITSNAASGTSIAVVTEVPTGVANPSYVQFFPQSTSQTLTFRLTNTSAGSTGALVRVTGAQTGLIGVLDSSGTGGATFSGPIQQDSTNAATLRLTGTSVADSTISGAISSTGAGALAVAKTGTNKWVLSGANTYTGATSISAGTLSAQSESAFGSSTQGAVTQTGGTIDISGGVTLNKGTVAANTVGVSGSTALTSTSGNNEWIIGAIAMNSTTIVDIAAGARLKLNNSGALSGVGFGVTKNGTGELELANTDNTFTGAVTVAAGTLTVTKLANSGAGSTSSIGTGAGTSAISLTGTLKYAGTAPAGHSTNRSITFTGAAPALDASGSGAVTYSACTTAGVTAGGTITFTGSSTAANTLSANLSNGAGTLNVAKSGASKWVLSGALTYTGSTAISDGTLDVSGANRVLSGGVSMSGGTLASTGTVEANVVMTGGTITAQLTGNKTLDVDSGIATLEPTNNDNTFTGNTTVDAGATLRLITGVNPALGNGKVLGDSNVTVAGYLRTKGDTTQKGQMRYGGDLTFQANSRLYVGSLS